VDTIEFQALAVPEPEALAALYADKKLSGRQVAAALGCAKSTVQRALGEQSIPTRTRRKYAADDQPGTYHVGQLRYGTKLTGPAVAEHVGEQRTIATMSPESCGARATGEATTSSAHEGALELADADQARHRRSNGGAGDAWMEYHDILAVLNLPARARSGGLAKLPG
jgi:hypothetical protein